MGVSCIFDFIVGKMGLISEQNVMNHTRVRNNPTTEFQLATNVHRFKMLNALDVIWIAHKVNVRELLQGILSAARSINNAAVLHKVTSSLVTCIRNCISAGGGHFEQFA